MQKDKDIEESQEEEKKFECKRNSVMGKENQQSEWKIYRSTTGAYKQSDFRKIELLQCDRQYMLIG